MEKRLCCIDNRPIQNASTRSSIRDLIHFLQQNLNCFIIPAWRYLWDLIISTLDTLFDNLWLHLYLAGVFKLLFQGTPIIFIIVILEHNWHFLSGCDRVRWKISLIHNKCLQVHDFTENLRIWEVYHLHLLIFLLFVSWLDNRGQFIPIDDRISDTPLSTK